MERHERAAKERVAALVNEWSVRSGLQKHLAAIKAGFGDGQALYHACLNIKRPVNIAPEQAIGLVTFFATYPQRDLRCTAEEAVEFLVLAGLPVERFAEVAQAGLFPHEEWQAALQPRLTPALGEPVVSTRRGATARQQKEPLQPEVETGGAQGDRLLASMPGAGDPLAGAAGLPKPSRMPFRRNPLFRGRHAELQRLAGLVRAAALGERHPVAVVGLGGVGKTNLAAEFVHRYGQFFAGGVFWLNFTDPHNIDAEALACGDAGLVAHAVWSAESRAGQVRLVRQAWQEPVPRLLVFDNCEDEAVLERWLPTSGGCVVLITSRHVWRAESGIGMLELRHLSQAEGVALLQAYRPDLTAPDAGLAGLVDDLGGLPLALHLAGSYLATFRHDPPYGDPAQLRHELAAQGLLSHEAMRGVGVAPSPTGHDLQLERTLAVSIARLDLGEPVDALALRLLCRASFFAPGEPLPRGVLAAADAGTDDRTSRRAIGRLITLGLLEQLDASVLIHPLVATYGRQLAGDDSAQTAVEHALVAAVERAYEDDAVEVLRQLLPHVRLAAERAAPRQDELAVRLWNALPFALDAAGNIAASVAALEQAERMLVTTGQAESELAGEVLNNLGAWHAELGAWALARSYHERALGLRRALCPAGAMPLAESCNNLANVLRELGETRAARALFEEALGISSARLGPGHLVTLATRNNVALLLKDEGQFAAAAEQLRAVLAVAQEVFGADSTRAARTHHNLADALRHLGEYDAARQQFDTAIANSVGRLGAEHQDVLVMRFTGVLLARDQHGWAAGLAEARALLADAERVLGVGHTLTEQVRAFIREETAPAL
jgi:tetratricopeptide (TPR) repeat protein